MVGQAFIIMPFGDEFDDFYRYSIRKVLEEVGYEVQRADDIKSQQSIMKDIVRSILGAKLIVADISDSNPNVYYELGIAHTLGKKVVLFSKDIEEVPFDLRAYRIIKYGTNFVEMNKAMLELKELAISADDESNVFGNPVIDYIGDSLKNYTIQSEAVDADGEQEGLFDCIQGIFDSVKGMGEVIKDISERQNQYNSVLAVNTEMLSGAGVSADVKQFQLVLRRIAVINDEFAKLLNDKNAIFSGVVHKMGSYIDMLINVNFNAGELQQDNISGLLEGIDSTQEFIEVARDNASSLVATLKGLPRMQKELNRSINYLLRAYEGYLGNIEMTLSIFNRARMAKE